MNYSDRDKEEQGSLAKALTYLAFMYAPCMIVVAVVVVAVSQTGAL